MFACGSVTIIPPTIDEILNPFIEVNDYSDGTNTFTDAGDSSGLSGTCGGRNFDVTFADLSPVPWLSIAGTTVTVEPRGVSTQIYEMTLKTTSALYNTVTPVTTTFYVSVLDDCDVTPDFTHDPLTDLITFIVGGTDPSKTLLIGFWNKNNCDNYVETLSFEPDLDSYPYISVSDRTVTVGDDYSGTMTLRQIFVVTTTL